MLPYFHFGSETIFTYPLILGIIWALSFSISKKLINKKNLTIPNFNFFFLAAFTFAWMGAKIIFLVTLDEATIQKAIVSTNFWLGGGFVFYGGLIFGTLFVYLYSLKYKIKLQDFSFTIPVLTLGHAIGRIACFLAGCCYGTNCDLPWAVNLHGAYRHPVQLYESILLFLLAGFLYMRFKNNKSIIMEYLIAYSVIRFILEFLRGDSIRGILAIGLSTSQIISLSLILCCTAFCCFRKSK